MSKLNPILAIGAVIALLLFLFFPVVSIAFITFGVNGQLCMKISGVFTFALIMICISLVAALIPMGKISSVIGLVSSLCLLVIGLSIGNILNQKIDQLSAILQIDLIQSNQITTAIITNLFQMGWGLIAAVVILTLTSVAGLFIPLSDRVTPFGQKSVANNSSSRGSNSTYSSGRGNDSNIRNIYRH